MTDETPNRPLYPAPELPSATQRVVQAPGDYADAFGCNGDSVDHPIRKARVSDVRQILELVNGFASSNLMLPRGPQYLYETIRSFVVAVDQSRRPAAEIDNADSHDLIVACGSLHVLWEDVAEIRSTAIHPEYQKKGLGRQIVEFMKVEARELGIRKLFTFTLAEGFFQSVGFERKDNRELPSKVWGECSRCPKFFKCDEVGMILELD